MSEAGTLEYGAMIMGLGGGLALFLYGMRKLTESLKTLAGARMKTALARLTTNRYSGLAAGAAVTAVIQSSSVTTVLVVGFISAGLMTFTQSVGVIMGANIGTTVTAQIIAFRVTEYSLALIASGFIMEVAAKSQRVRQIGMTLMGLGLLFYGMELMSVSTAPLKTWTPFTELLRDVGNPLLGVLVGFLFTALVQSSSATTGIVIVLASAGFLTLESGIAIAFGANVGTCVTAALSAIGRPPEAVRAAVVHVIFNVLGVILWIGFIPQIAEVVRAISPSSPELTGAARLAAEAPRQIANAHTLFNVLNAFVFIWFASLIERLAYRIVPVRRVRVSGGMPKFLDPMYLDQPALAIDRVKLETERLGRRVLRNVEDSFDVVMGGETQRVARLRSRDEDVDDLHGAIVDYLGRITLAELVDPLPQRLQTALGVANYLENIGDVVETDLVNAAEQRLSYGVVLDAETRERIGALHRTACRVLEEGVAAYLEGDANRAVEARERKSEFNSQADAARLRAGRSLAPGESHRLETYRIENDIIECYSRIHALARRIARLAMLSERDEPDTAPKPSREPDRRPASRARARSDAD